MLSLNLIGTRKYNTYAHWHCKKSLLDRCYHQRLDLLFTRTQQQKNRAKRLYEMLKTKENLFSTDSRPWTNINNAGAVELATPHGSLRSRVVAGATGLQERHPEATNPTKAMPDRRPLRSNPVSPLPAPIKTCTQPKTCCTSEILFRRANKTPTL